MTKEKARPGDRARFFFAEATRMGIAPMPKASGRARTAPTSLNGGGRTYMCTHPAVRARPLVDG
ncbi:MAG: hypothetical protein CFE34_09130 [Rhodobacteraceae bacterium PARR1]|nr:MAG: hypothetical protein CFE34_09130 [Rhodobacteraceae bacterium PARR1]